MKMETVSVVSNLLEANCDDEFKKTFQKQKLKFVLLYIISTVVIILLCVNTILLKETQSEEHLTMNDCIQWKCWNSTASPPRCAYVDRYPLGEEIYVRICQLGGNITLDIRLFKDGKWTDDGIQLNKMQWQYLKKSVDHIDSSLLKTSV
jgi:hypothetical protein